MLNIPPDVERDAIFVKVYLQTGDGLDACKRAGFIINGYDDRTVAEYLLDRCDIQEAIKVAKESKARKPASVDITRESIISDLDAIHQSAMIDKDYTPAIAAKKLQAQLMGVFLLLPIAGAYWKGEKRAKLVQPGFWGAHDWRPMSYNPNTGLVYIPAHIMSAW